MRYIDMQTWSRRDHFRLFNTFNHPHFSMCANVDLTVFHPVVKQCGYSFTVTIAYIIARASNAIPEFRYRIRDGKVVEHEIVNPSFTILVNEDIFCFCTIDYIENFPVFATRAAKSIAYVKMNPNLDTDPERDDMLFMSPIPWVSFTSFIHPMQFHPADSVPRFAWGKIFEDGGLLKMPLGVQGHHALMDGIHMGRFYEKVQEYLFQPKVVLGEL
ncbi:MAG: CatA-like O-acetyltransferase [Candidatus Hodarchaeota archaeon]